MLRRKSKDSRHLCDFFQNRHGGGFLFGSLSRYEVREAVKGTKRRATTMLVFHPTSRLRNVTDRLTFLTPGSEAVHPNRGINQNL